MTRTWLRTQPVQRRFPSASFVGNPNYFDPKEETSFEASFNAFSDLMKTKPQFLDQYGDQAPAHLGLGWSRELECSLDGTVARALRMLRR